MKVSDFVLLEVLKVELLLFFAIIVSTGLLRPSNRRFFQNLFEMMVMTWLITVILVW